ncbi:MAG TPA: glycosyltransferase family 1 protein [Bryobacteraceae bacterium]|nr:glycosyltransferase family 1 protein [Bryobacteraceae bacterium]
MPLQIALDTRRVADFGIGTYIRNLVRALAHLDSENRYTLITTDRPAPEFANLPANFQTAAYTGKNRSGLAEIGYGFFLKKLHADLYHMPLNAVPFSMPKPYLVTIHDMSTLLFASQTGYRNRLRHFYLRRGLLRADRVVAVSMSTCRDVEELLGIPAKRIRVIYNAPDPIFRAPGAPLAALGGEESGYPAEIQRVLDRYRIHYPFLLYVGRTNPQKNIPRLVEAFAVLRGEIQDHPVYNDLRLLIIGDEISRYPALRHAVIQSRVEDTVRFLGFVPIETLRSFYQAAAAFVFPSLYEGFGLPPLEAMACGTPVVCSHVNSLPEVVGGAAEVVNPENVFDIARGIREVLLDRDRRRDMIQRGFEQARQFSWERTAGQVLEAYEEIGSYKKRPR